MTTPEQTITRIYTEVYNQGNLESILEIYHPEFRSHPNAVSPEGISGLHQLKQFVLMLRRAIPDIRFEIMDAISNSEKVAIRWRMSGTLKESLFDFPPTGVSGSVTGITIHRLKDGKAIEAWEEVDLLGGFRQFGLIAGEE